ncbi:MAG: hypothetical protein WKH64_04365 [Chloroflexia bacterium]
MWGKLKDLFSLINMGDPPLGVATFNGGLFDPEGHPFLETHVVGDARLQAPLTCSRAWTASSWTTATSPSATSAQSTRGCLYHLEALDQPAGGWTVALKPDNTERKATGGYYTPDFIVKYIVDRTLGPVLRDAIRGARATRRRSRLCWA